MDGQANDLPLSGFEVKAWLTVIVFKHGETKEGASGRDTRLSSSLSRGRRRGEGSAVKPGLSCGLPGAGSELHRNQCSCADAAVP